MARVYYPSNSQPSYYTDIHSSIQTNSVTTSWPKTPIQVNTLHSHHHDVAHDRTWIISNPNQDARTFRSLSMPGSNQSSTTTFVVTPRGPRRSTSMTRASRNGVSQNDSNANIPYVTNPITSYPIRDFIVNPSSQGTTSPRPSYSKRAPTPPTPPNEEDLRTSLQKSIDSYKPLIYSATSTKPRSGPPSPHTKTPTHGSRSPPRSPRSPRNNTSTPLPWSSPHRPIPSPNEPQYLDSVSFEREKEQDLSSIIQRATPIKPEAIVFPNGASPQIEYAAAKPKRPDPIIVEQNTYTNPTLVVDQYESPTYPYGTPTNISTSDFTLGSPLNSIPANPRYPSAPLTKTNVTIQDQTNRPYQFPNTNANIISNNTMKVPNASNAGLTRSESPAPESGLHKLLWFTTGLAFMLGSMFVSLVLSILDIKPKVASTPDPAYSNVTFNSGTNGNIKTYGKDAFSRSPYSNILANKNGRQQ